VVVGLLAGGAVGLINGLIIAYLGLSPFVTTLGMLAIARSVAVVLSGNRMIYKFGPGGPSFKALGSGAWHVTPSFELSSPLLFLILFTFVLAVVYKMTSWGRHVLAIGGNEQAALLTGVPVNRIKVQVYVFSALTAAFAAILSVGWAGSAINSQWARSQQQLHVHVDCIAVPVIKALAEYAPAFDSQWRAMTVSLQGRDYFARRLDSADLVDVAPLKLLADGVEGARSNMGAYSLAAVGATFDGKPGFVLLADPFSLEGGGHAEDLQDHDCAIARSTP
jgi:hypothetical protein